MPQCARPIAFALLLLGLVPLAACDYYADRMSVGEQQLKQGKYPQAQEAFAEAATQADDGERLYHSLKALAEAYEARGDVETADTLRRHAVMVMGHCLEDKKNGLRPCPVRDGDQPVTIQGST
jgi:tetratricopeptide (TPR) repeat protein